MALTSLVVCADKKAVLVLGQILKELSIEVENCEDLSAAADRLAKQHYDAVVLDCKDQTPALELITTVRKLPLNRGTLIIALVDGREQVRDIFGQGANFIVYKPVSAERAGSSLRAARGLMRARKAGQIASLAARSRLDRLRQRGKCCRHAARSQRRRPGHSVRTQTAATLQGLLSIQFAGRQIYGSAFRRRGVARLFRTRRNPFRGRSPDFAAHHERMDQE